MNIDKSIGHWSESSSYIDDIAYSIYLNEMKKKYNEEYERVILSYKFLAQNIFKYNSNHSYIVPYYQKAERLIRKEKLQKLPK